MSHGLLGFPQSQAPINVGRVVTALAPQDPQTEIVTPILESGTLALGGQVLTLALHEDPATYSTSFAVGNSLDRFGRLRWRKGDIQQVADFDIKGGGTVFPLAADWFQMLVVRQDLPNIPIFAFEPIRYMASASPSIGVANPLPPTRSFLDTIPANSAGTLLTVPVHATGVTLNTDLPSPDVMTVQINAQSGQTVLTQQIVNPTSTVTVPLPQGARTLRFNNGSLVNGATAVAIFSLAF